MSIDDVEKEYSVKCHRDIIAYMIHCKGHIYCSRLLRVTGTTSLAASPNRHLRSTFSAESFLHCCTSFASGRVSALFQPSH